MASNIYTPMRFIQTLARRSFIYKNRYIEDHQRSFSAPSFPPISVEQQEIQNTETIPPPPTAERIKREKGSRFFFNFFSFQTFISPSM